MKSQSVKALPSSALNTRCDMSALPGQTTADLADGNGLLGQERAVEALDFGARIHRHGYNIFALCDAQSGAMEAVRQHLRDLAKDGPAPPDWVYVQNYRDTRQPRAISLPAGQGRYLRDALDGAVRELKVTIPDIFEGEDYQSRVRAIQAPLEEAIQKLNDRAEAAGLMLVSEEDSFRFVPAKNGEELTKNEISSLSANERRRMEKAARELQAEFDDLMNELPQWEAEATAQLRRINYEFMSAAIDQSLRSLRETFVHESSVNSYLDDLAADMVENAHLFVEGGEAQLPVRAGKWSIQPAEPLMRYAVNLVVDNSEISGRPVIVEAHPTYSRLVGRMDQVADLGSVHSDFSMLRAGALVQANGGFLLIDAETLLELPAAWEALKTSLKTGAVALDTLREFLGDSDTGTVSPEPIPLNVKIVLFGDWFLHYALSVHDPDFQKLFRVQADFADSMPRSKGNEKKFAHLLAGIQRRYELKPFDRSAVARMVEESSRQAEDSERLSLQLDPLVEIMTEADFWAGEGHHRTVGAEDIEKAIEARVRRLDLHRELSSEVILRDFKRIATSGAVVGQVNALMVTGTDLLFGMPTRVTAQARMGTMLDSGAGQIVDIQRQVGRGGPSHSKGVLILGGYLRGRYLPDRPLSLSATLAFEQTYSDVDGDSASVAEMCALVSAISGVPLKQSFAVTGALSQRGEVQAIGAVNEKIEGFFDICAARGFVRDQGVIIPRANMKDLMLRRDVVEACKRGEFAIYAVEHVDQAMELLTGARAGRRGMNRLFPRRSVNRLAEDRLRAFSRSSTGASRHGWL